MSVVNQNFSHRRNTLLKSLLPQSIAIVRAANYTFRNGDVEHEWRQDSNFDYLTGINEPKAILVLSNIQKLTATIFCQAKDPERELWEGERLGSDKMISDYGMNQSFKLNDLSTQMPILLTNGEHIYFDFGHDPDFDKQIFSWLKQLQNQIRSGIQVPQSMHFLAPKIGAMRLRKDSHEIELMRQAGLISVLAHKQAMLVAQKNHNEAQVAANLEFTMRQQGAERCAFGSIVASGKNACTLHYRANNETFQEGSLMLIDAGAEYRGYASDITTCFPIGGRFSEPQKALYEAVLNTQEYVLEHCKVGQNINTLQELACRKICTWLCEFGILNDDLETLLQNKAYLPYYMHRIGHWIGKDVHDVGTYRNGEEWQAFEIGMTLTIEPGIYIREDQSVAEKWWGIGIRIEDTILITEQGYENLNPGLPRTVEEIERFLAPQH